MVLFDRALDRAWSFSFVGKRRHFFKGRGANLWFVSHVISSWVFHQSFLAVFLTLV